MWLVSATYTYDWLLSLNSSAQLRLLDIDDQISTLEVSRDGEVQREVPDRLRPFIGKRGLLFFLASTCHRLGSFVY